MNKETIISTLQTTYQNGVTLGYVDKDDFINDDRIIQNLLDGNMDEVREYLWDAFFEQEDVYIDHYLEVFGDELTDELRNIAVNRLCDHNDFNPLKEVLRNTGDVYVRLVFRSTYDLLRSGETIDEGCYLTDLANKVQIPGLVEKLEDEFSDIYSDYGEFTFVGKINLHDWVFGDGEKIKILKHTKYGLHNSYDGTTGDFSNTLEEDLVVSRDQFRLVLDTMDGYGINEVCGFTDEFWDLGGFKKTN